MQRTQCRHDVTAGGGIEIAGRLIGKDQRRTGHQCACDGDALLLAARQLARLTRQAVAETHALQCLGGAAPSFGAAHTGIDQWCLDVFQCTGARQQVEVLEHEADLAVAQFGELVGVQLSDIAPLQDVAAAVGYVQAAEDVHQGRLAGTRWPHDRDELAGLHGQVDAAQGVHVDAVQRVGLVQFADFDDRTAHDQLRTG